jgi:hypothetical protein
METDSYAKAEQVHHDVVTLARQQLSPEAIRDRLLAPPRTPQQDEQGGST